MAHPFDPDAGRFTGAPRTVLEGIRYNPANGRAAFSVSDSGVLAYVAGDVAPLINRVLTLFDPHGTRLREVGAPGPWTFAKLSPDGTRAVAVADSIVPPVVQNLSLLDVDTGLAVRFTPDPDVNETFPVWSPDGLFIVFSSVRDKIQGVYRRSAGGGAATDEELATFQEPVRPTGFSRDGKLLLLTVGAGPNQRIWVLPVEGERKPFELFPGTRRVQWDAVFSPDGKWIAFTSGSSPTDSEVYVQAYPPDDNLRRISPATGRHPAWSDDGKRLIYRTQSDEIVAVDLTFPTGQLPQPSAPVTLFGQPRPFRLGWFFSTDRLAQRFLLVTRRGSEQTPAAGAESAPPRAEEIQVIVNWTTTLKKQ
jgi:hypothetical protein